MERYYAITVGASKIKVLEALSRRGYAFNHAVRARRVYLYHDTLKGCLIDSDGRLWTDQFARLQPDIRAVTKYICVDEIPLLPLAEYGKQFIT